MEEVEKKERAKPGSGLGRELAKLETMLVAFGEKYGFAGDRIDKLKQQVAVCRECLQKLNKTHDELPKDLRMLLNSALRSSIEDMVRKAFFVYTKNGVMDKYEWCRTRLRGIGWRV